MVRYAPATTSQPVGDGEMQPAIREALSAVGMPDLDVTGETRWKHAPVWLLWLPGMGVPPNESLGGHGLVATLGDGLDGYVYAAYHAYFSIVHQGTVVPLEGEEAANQNAAYPPCPGELWDVRYPKGPAGMAALARDFAVVREWKASVTR